MFLKGVFVAFLSLNVCDIAFARLPSSAFSLRHAGHLQDPRKPNRDLLQTDTPLYHTSVLDYNTSSPHISINDTCLLEGDVIVTPCSSITLYNQSFGSRPQQSLENGQCSTCCPYAKGADIKLSAFSLTFQDASSNTSANLVVSPAFNPNTLIRFFQTNITTGSAGLLQFTPLNISTGSAFRIRLDFSPEYSYVLPETPVSFNIDGNATHLLEFDVISASCASDIIEEYSITIYATDVQTAVNTSSSLNTTYQSNEDQCKYTASSYLAMTQSTCANQTILPRPMYETNSPSIQLPNFACSCLCPYPKGATMQIYNFTAAFYSDFDHSWTNVVPFTTNPESNDNSRYVWYRGNSHSTGMLQFTINNASIGCHPLFKFNFQPANFSAFEVGDTLHLLVVPGTNFLQFDIAQERCAGDDVLESSLTIYQ